MRPPTYAYRFCILLLLGAPLFAQPYVSNQSYGSTSTPLPPMFSCPNEGTTGTATGLVVKLSAANTCIAATTADATNTAGVPMVGICFTGCGTSGNAQIIPFGAVVPCTFDNATTFGHFSGMSTTAAGDCTDLGSNSNANTGVLSVGRVLDTGAAGTHNVLLQPVQNSVSTLFGSNTRVNASSFTGQFLLRTAAAGAGVFLQLGGQATGHPCLADSGLLLQVLNSGATGCSGVSALGVDHYVGLASTPPTIGSGFGTSPAIVSGGDSAFIVNVGTGGIATTGVANFGTAWTAAPACEVQDSTTGILQRGVASTTAVTITSASAWTASDKLVVHCYGQGGL